MAKPALPIGWERTALAVDKVRDRLRRATAALRDASVPHAVVGDHAVGEWVGRVDEAAVRTTRDVDLLLSRADFASARSALEQAGFVHAQILGVECFLDGRQGRPQDAVHIVFAAERVQPEYIVESPGVSESEAAAQFQVVSLDGLVRLKLNSFRLKDRVHLLDMIQVGLIDSAWPARLPRELAARLPDLLDNPDA
jgi:hypothetical protein